ARASSFGMPPTLVCVFCVVVCVSVVLPPQPGSASATDATSADAASGPRMPSLTLPPGSAHPDPGTLVPQGHGNTTSTTGFGPGQTTACWPLPSTTIPPGLTWYRCRSRSASTPMCAPSGTTTFLSRIALRTTEPLPIRTLSITTLPSTYDPASSRTPGDSTELRTVPAETTTPLETIDSWAEPLSTNFAGGDCGGGGRVGQSPVLRLEIGCGAARSMCAS